MFAGIFEASRQTEELLVHIRVIIMVGTRYYQNSLSNIPVCQWQVTDNSLKQILVG